MTQMCTDPVLPGITSTSHNLCNNNYACLLIIMYDNQLSDFKCSSHCQLIPLILLQFLVISVLNFNRILMRNKTKDYNLIEG